MAEAERVHDRLADIFLRQAELDGEIARLRALDFPPEVWAEKLSIALIAELIEVLEALNFKWWKNPHPVDGAAIQEELADVLHFFVSLCLHLGVGPDELYEAYVRKQRENLARQHGRSGRPGYAALPPRGGEADALERAGGEGDRQPA
ncbi:MAG: dUTPase [Bacillota bacterium]|nr:dUTPase [Bacillota bacterium]